MLTTIVCLVSLVHGSVQTVRLDYTQATLSDLRQELHIPVKATQDQIQKRACNNLQLAIEIANDET
jgi:hypothetical protein